MRSVGQRFQHWPLRRKFNLTQRRHRATQPVTKSADIDPQQTAKQNSNSRFVRNDEDVSSIKFFADFLYRSLSTGRDNGGQFSVSGCVTRWINQPLNVIIVIFLRY